MVDDIRKNQRVAVLVDSANIFITAQKMGVRVNYSKILERLNTRQIVRAVVYHVQTSPEKEAIFLQKIKELGFDVKTKQQKKYSNGKTKGDMDVDLTVDAIALGEKCDVITLVSGDGDYVPLVHYLKAKGIRIEAMAFKCSTAHDLIESVDEFIPITEDMFYSPKPQ